MLEFINVYSLNPPVKFLASLLVILFFLPPPGSKSQDSYDVSFLYLFATEIMTVSDNTQIDVFCFLGFFSPMPQVKSATSGSDSEASSCQDLS